MPSVPYQALTPKDIDVFLQGICKLVKTFGLRAISDKLIELLDLDEDNRVRKTEGKIADIILSCYGIKDLSNLKNKRGRCLEANVMRIILLYDYCDYSQKEIAFIVGETVQSINQKLNAYTRALENKEIVNENDKQRIFTKNFMSQISIADEQMKKFINQLNTTKQNG